MCMCARDVGVQLYTVTVVLGAGIWDSKGKPGVKQNLHRSVVLGHGSAGASLLLFNNTLFPFSLITFPRVAVVHLCLIGRARS